MVSSWKAGTDEVSFIAAFSIAPCIPGGVVEFSCWKTSNSYPHSSRTRTLTFFENGTISTGEEVVRGEKLGILKAMGRLLMNTRTKQGRKGRVSLQTESEPSRLLPSLGDMAFEVVCSVVKLWIYVKLQAKYFSLVLHFWQPSTEPQGQVFTDKETFLWEFLFLCWKIYCQRSRYPGLLGSCEPEVSSVGVPKVNYSIYKSISE